MTDTILLKSKLYGVAGFYLLMPCSDCQLKCVEGDDKAIFCCLM